MSTNTLVYQTEAEKIQDYDLSSLLNNQVYLGLELEYVRQVHVAIKDFLTNIQIFLRGVGVNLWDLKSIKV